MEFLAALLTVGMATVDITPSQPLALGGYTARNGALMEVGGDPLRARAMAIGDVVLIGVELLTIPESLQREVQQRLGPQHPVILFATHTHCAPDSQMLNDRMTMQLPGIASFSRRQLAAFSEKVASAAQEALRHRVPVERVTWSQGRAPWARGRRAYAAPDNRATRLAFHSEGRTFTLDTFSAHPTLYDENELKARGDWPGELMTLTGGLVGTSGLGDVSPTVAGRGPKEQSVELARGLLDVVSRAQERPLQQVPRWSRVEVPLGDPVPHPEFAASVGLPEVLAAGIVKRFALPTGTVSALAFGDVAWVFVSAEPTSSFTRAAEAVGLTQGFRRVIVVSHAQGWNGYLLMPEDYDRGKYEATLSFHGRDASGRWLRAIRAALGQLWLGERPASEIKNGALEFVQSPLSQVGL